LKENKKKEISRIKKNKIMKLSKKSNGKQIRKEVRKRKGEETNTR
jgi:hypothetical protein